MDDLLSEFLTETSEGLAVLDVELVQLEQNPNDQDLLSNIFRYMHTIKGTCGFLGLPRLESVAHAGENILGKFREGALEVTPMAVSLILECLDKIRTILGFLEQNEKEPEGEDSDLIARLNAYADGGESANGGAEAGPDDAAEAPEAETAAAEDDQAAAESEPPEEPKAEEVPEVVAAAPAPAPEKTPAKAAESAPKGEANSGGESSVANQTIRVNVELLENLMTMVSEMVLTRNQLLQILRGQKDSEFAAPLQRLNHVVS